ncbi:MAG: hypothetical protein JRI25_12335 [Deltaproteobacteria bacterium]|nr:hypothetical protein [Deltaproteobacteria bacterium]MBW2255372.1 hypothetical protein [Deltaproteobacteria bacterium]
MLFRNSSGRRTRQEWTIVGLLLVAAWCTACPRSGHDAADDPLPGLLRVADVAWVGRGRGGFEPVEEALLEARTLAPGHPEVLWRLARLETAQGLAAPDTVMATRHYGRAREFGMECLQAEATFAQSYAVRGWSDAVTRVPPAREPCLEWTTFAWARWLAAFGGAAGAIDLPTLDLLHEHLHGDFGPDPLTLGRWTEGILYATRPPEEGRDLGRAMTALEDAIRVRPEELARRADLVILVGDPLGDRSIRSHHLEVMRRGQTDTPENRRALALVASGEDVLVPE